ncbi:hypothetical protein C7B64_20175 [Merismopedia glauca CCAP 1448/3]|uniref:Uncharacterized protein n=1 Tax=Merismopedia glauca CCAP 1448/3 TaxID=1296344 RepID=A0A2T1BYW5_9CYAN|nr:hypothetical protein C7B64_20175 [Merismopedia glauca CCAP 1448/3]
MYKRQILKGLGFVSAPLYLFPKFFVGKAKVAATDSRNKRAKFKVSLALSARYQDLRRQFG